MIAFALWLLIAILLLLVAVLCLPVRLRVVAMSEPRYRYQVFVSVLGGQAPELRVYDSKDRKLSRRRKKRPRRPSRKKPNTSVKGIGWIREVPALIGQLIRAFRIVRVEAEGSFGFDDPADTGILYGYLSPLIHTGGGLPGVTLNLRPDFEHAGLKGKLDALLEVTPVNLLAPAMGFGWRIFRARHA